MNDNVTTVTVKNKLGGKFNNRKIQVNTWANEQTTSSLTILPRGEKRVYPINPEARQPVDPVSLKLDSIEIEVLEAGNEIAIPIGIDTTDDLNVEVSHVSEEDRWVIMFKPQIVPPQTKNGDSNVNVTLGQDEPPNMLLYFLVVFVLGFIAGLLF